MTVLLKAPHELSSVHLSISTVIHSSENEGKSSDSMSTSSLHDLLDLVKNLIGRFSGQSEDWVDIWVITASLSGEPVGELFVIKFTIRVSIILVEESL